MKLLSSIHLLFAISFCGNTAIANHIKLPSSISSQSTINKTGFNTKTLNQDTKADPPETEKTFNQELQWRILNLLAQQLFQNNHETFTSDVFTTHWLYHTQTFSVNISALNSDVFVIKITDTQLGEETKLEIPRL